MCQDLIGNLCYQLYEPSWLHKRFLTLPFVQSDCNCLLEDSSKNKKCLAEVPSEEFELTTNSLGAHMKVTESSPDMGHGELILTTFI